MSDCHDCIHLIYYYNGYEEGLDCSKDKELGNADCEEFMNVQ